METLLALTVSGSALTILLLVLRYGVMKKMPSTVYYYAWLFVLLRFLLPLPGLVPSVFGGADAVSETAAYTAAAETGTADRQPALYETAPVAGTQGISEDRTEKSAPRAGAAAPAAAEKKGFDWKSPALWLAMALPPQFLRCLAVRR